MSNTTPTEERPRSPSLGGRLEAMCDRFEAAWQAGLRPPIEDYLGEMPEPGQAVLFRELLELELTYRRLNGERPTPAEYQRRFRQQAAVIETVFGAAAPPRAVRRVTGADPNLLFGLLALQNNFIDREALVAAFSAWVADKSRSLQQRLLERGAVDAETYAVLEALARKHIKMYGGDVEQSLAALSSLDSVREDLERLGDPELQTCLTRVARNLDRPDPDATPPHARTAGSSTAAGVRFRILRLHRTGGLGAVYVARDDELHREVALKEIRERHAHDPDSRSRFVQEAEITGRLEHPGIVPVYGLGTYADGRPFYAMRFIKGDNFKDAIARFHEADVPGRDPGERALAQRKLLGRFVAACNAIAYAHSRGIVHRDVKPSNILLGPYGETLVVDWGLAKPVGRPEESPRTPEGTLRPESAGSGTTTLPGDTPGTPAYMSPEQAAGDLDKVGLPSDVYSLGATLYCLLTGQSPFEDRDVDVVMGKVKRGDFPPPRAVNPAVDPALEAICSKAMALQPKDRYATPGALAEDVNRWLAGEPVSAWHEPLSIQTRRWMRRNRTVVSVVAAALVVGVIGLSAVAVVQSWAKSNLEATYRQLIQANVATIKERNNAESALRRAEAVLGFLKDGVLKAARPEGEEGGLGVNVTVRKAVEAAEPKLVEKFKDQPVVEADVSDTLGDTYYSLGDFPRAIRRYERAMELRRTSLGPDHLSTLKSRTNVGAALLGGDRIAEAIDMLEATVKQFKSTVGLDHPDALESRNNLAAAYLAANRIHEAIDMFKATLERRQATLGPGHRDSCTTRNNLAKAYLDDGRIAEAIEMHEENLKQRLSTLGPDHSHTLNTCNNLAAAYFRANRIDEAIKMFEPTLEQLKRKLGSDHPETIKSRYNLAVAYRAAGQLDRAISLLEQALQGFRVNDGPDQPSTVMCERRLADTYTAAGRYTAAEPLLRDALERARKKFGSADLRSATAMDSLGLNLIQQRKWVDAETFLREALAIRAKTQPDDWRTSESRSLLGGSLLGQKKYADAEPLILDGYAGMKAREAKIPAPAKLRLTEAAQRVVQLYDAWGKKEKSEEWRRKVGAKPGINKTTKP